MPPGKWTVAVGEEVPRRCPGRCILGQPLGAPRPISYFWKIGHWLLRRVTGSRPCWQLEWWWQSSPYTPKSSLTATFFLPPVTCLGREVQASSFGSQRPWSRVLWGVIWKAETLPHVPFILTCFLLWVRHHGESPRQESSCAALGE